MTQYAALIYSRDVDWTQPEYAQQTEEYNRFSADHGPKLRGGAALHPTSTATTVRVTGARGGDVVTTDGPYAETKEALTGFYLFEAPDLDRFRSLALGRHALETGGAAPTILNAANEIAVAAFIAGQIGFGAIAELVEATLGAAERRNATAEPQDIDEALAVDHMARSLAHDLLPEIAAKSF